MIGQNIGKYKVLDRVGRGGMGTVYRALDETLDREVAIKVLNADLNDPEVAGGSAPRRSPSRVSIIPASRPSSSCSSTKASG